MRKHLCLVFSPIDPKYQDALSHFAPPLGLVALQNYVQRKLPSVRVSILDGSVQHTVESVCKFIDREKPDIVGQSVQLISYANALLIAKHSHQAGILNVFGGHHASQMATKIIDARSDVVDYVVTGDGEEPLVGLLENRDPSTIPNLVFSREGKIHRSGHWNLCLNDAPVINYAGVDFDPYSAILRKADFNGEEPIHRYLRIYSHKGCGNRGNSTACVFCGRADQGVRFKSPSRFWDEVRQVVEIHGADYIFDVGDDFLFDSNWVHSVAELRPTLAPYQLGIFGRANRVDSTVASSLARIGVTDVVIGFESGDDVVLRNCGKMNTTAATNTHAARLLFENGIDITASFVLGLPGENARSLENTYEAAFTIVEMAKSILGRPPREMVANLIEPSPGSPAYANLVKYMPDVYGHRDLLSLEDMQRDYFRCYFGLTSLTAYENFRNQLRETAERIHALVNFSDAQGWLSREELASAR